ncbi:MAG: hypothetical protein UHO61_00355 [Acutalibacteraceae bacterium]|nr:hypothetical protein [Acutalibacteraceae bacterium]
MIKIKVFFKSFYISFVLALCLFIGIYGTAKAYENMRLIGFGEYKKAVEIKGNVLRILDFEIELF